MSISFSLATALIIQYAVLTVILHLRKDWLGLDGPFGIVPWFPIIGPIAIGILIYIVTPIVVLFLLPLSIYNVFKYLISKIRKD